MPTYDASNAECRVFTFKDGLLSAIAHDLEIDVERFEVEVAEDGSITASFEVASLRVLDAVVGGQRSPGTLSAKDKTKIEATMLGDVLHVKKHRKVRFESTQVGEASVEGRLELHGRSQKIRLRRTGDEVEVTLHQPDFGIKPFSVMLGTLKVKPGVLVRLRLQG